MIWTIHALYWYTYKLCIAVLPYSSCVRQYKEPLLCSIAVQQYRVWHHEYHGIVCDCVLVNFKLLPVYQCYTCTLLWVSCVCYHSCDRVCMSYLLLAAIVQPVTKRVCKLKTVGSWLDWKLTTLVTMISTAKQLGVIHIRVSSMIRDLSGR
jgi:hypothetical protein